MDYNARHCEIKKQLFNAKKNQQRRQLTEAAVTGRWQVISGCWSTVCIYCAPAACSLHFCPRDASLLKPSGQLALGPQCAGGSQA